MKKYWVILFLVIANLFWGGHYVFGKYVVAEMDPLQITFIRWIIAVVFLFPIAQIIERPDWKKVWRKWKLLLAMAAFGIIGYNFFLYTALQYTSSLDAALINSLNPALIVLFSVIFLREKIGPINIGGLLISLLGVLLILTKGQLQQIFSIHYNQGDLIMLFVIFNWTVYSILARKIKGIPPISATAASVFIGIILLIPFMIFNGVHFPHSEQAIVGILYIGILPSVGSFVFWNIAIQKIGASRAGIYLNFITVFTAIISAFLGQPITLIQLVGGLLVFLGVYLSSKKSRTIEVKPQTSWELRKTNSY
ncbi:DMT family transporter [Bacillus sp. 03113]|uniref:DMT family transporter n=1 Tax=Bacillus sp. 03113 TaxID=2578211 RepID=UPI001141E5E4|nr:DMT family transporter [Bacillus sp. 03113]